MSRDTDVTFGQFSTSQQDQQILSLIADEAQSVVEDFLNEKCQEAYDQGYDGDKFDRPDLSREMEALIARDYYSDVTEILQAVAGIAFSEGQSDKASDDEDEASDEGGDD